MEHVNDVARAEETTETGEEEDETTLSKASISAYVWPSYSKIGSQPTCFLSTKPLRRGTEAKNRSGISNWRDTYQSSVVP